tara:strand:+ start:455 stop:634 length:180 start_codon:yes stop_codon:yes gene_type:complete
MDGTKVYMITDYKENKTEVQQSTKVGPVEVITSYNGGGGTKAIMSLTPEVKKPDNKWKL